MKKILIQLDTDSHPSSFDSVVAVDAGVEELFQYGLVTPDTVEPLVHGSMFTRGLGDLKNTAIFVGGSNVADGEQVFDRVCKTFFGSVRVSVMIDSNGSNTTAAAAVLAAKQHLDLSGIEALVLGGTGPVGQRVAQLLAMQGANVRVGSRSQERAAEPCHTISELVENATLTPYATGEDLELQVACEGATLIIAAGAAGVTFLTADQRRSLGTLRVAIDLNAVPPAGLAGIEVMDKAADREGVICYGAVGVGGTKMKIHKAAVRQLFDANDQVLDTEAIFKIGEALGS
jgi:hypothetical protein